MRKKRVENKKRGGGISFNMSVTWRSIDGVIAKEREGGRDT